MDLDELSEVFLDLASSAKASGQITDQEAGLFSRLCDEGHEIIHGEVALEKDQKAQRLQEIITTMRRSLTSIKWDEKT